MHSLSQELLSTKVLHLRKSNIMDKKIVKLLALPKAELVRVAIEVRLELDQPSITDVLLESSTTKEEICNDILHTIQHSVGKSLDIILCKV